MSNEDLDMDSLFGEVADLIKQTDLSNVSAYSTGFEELPIGYYLTEVIKAEFTRSKTSNKPMVSLRLRIVDDGYKLVDNDMASADVHFEPITGVKGRYVFKHYVLTDSSSLKRFVSDMKKFEDPEHPGNELLPEQAWSDVSVMREAISLLETLNSRIWVHVSESKKKDGTVGTWTDLESFKRAEEIGLPVE